MKNICFVDWDYSKFNGIERVLQGLSMDLSKKYNVHIVSVCKGNKGEGFTVPDDVRCKYMINGSRRIREATVSAFFPLLKYLKNNKIDIVFVMGYYPVWITFLVSKLIKARFIFCDHGAIANQLDDRNSTSFRKLAAKHFDKVITLTDKNLNDYREMFGVPGSRLQRIYNWIDDEILKCALKYNKDSKAILTVSRFTSEKGMDMLVDVAREVFTKHSDWQWHVFGDGEEFEKIQRLLSEKNLQGNVILKGKSSEIYREYGKYAMYVLTSYREGLPLVLLEAQANRLPIVSFDCVTGPREIINDGENGFLIECYDKDKMAGKICELIESQALRESFSSRSYVNIEKFDKEKILNQWCDLIEE